MPAYIAKLLFILFLLVSYFPTYAQDSYQKLSNEQIKATPLKTARSLADAMLTAQKKGQAYTLNESEATPAIREDFTPAKQLESYSAIHALFGDYQSLTFVEAYQTTSAPVYQIFRFKGKFEKGDTQPEVRVVLNENAQLAGYDIRPWEDAL